MKADSSPHQTKDPYRIEKSYRDLFFCKGIAAAPPKMVVSARYSRYFCMHPTGAHDKMNPSE